MPLVINSNTSSQNAATHLSALVKKQQDHLRRLSSGEKSAVDDAAAVAIAERFAAQISSLGQSSQNAYDGLSLTQTAEGSLNEVSDILGELEQISVQAKNGTLSDEDKATLQQQADDLLGQLDQVTGSSEFNGINLLDGSVSSVEVGIDAGTTPGVDSISIELPAVTTSALGLTGLDISASGVSEKIDAAINSVAKARADFGSKENRLSSSIANLSDRITNLTDAKSRIRDIDYARETSAYANSSIRTQAAIAIQAQANLQPQTVLALLS